LFFIGLINDFKEVFIQRSIKEGKFERNIRKLKEALTAIRAIK
jgi:hypothetical protein